MEPNSVRWQAAFGLLPIILLLAQVPVSVAGWGVREGAAVIFLSFAGIAKPDAITLSLVFGALTLLTTALGD